MVSLDGFTLSHSLEPLEVHADDAVRAFVGEPPAGGYALLGDGEPITIGPLALPDSYMEFRWSLAQAMERAIDIIADETAAFNTHFGRALPTLLEPTALDDAQHVILMMGSYADSVRAAVTRWRAEGRRVGLVRLVAFRPFPAAHLARLLAGRQRVIVMERADTVSTQGGPLGIEVRAALYPGSATGVQDVIFGLGGRELRDADLAAVGAWFDDPRPQALRYLGLQEQV
jgi:pyruvate ferredoxin oxidoreductase alpha subunit